MIAVRDAAALPIDVRMRMRVRGAVLAALVLSLIGAGCERASVAALSNTPGVQGSLTVAPSPPAIGDARLAIRLQDAQGRPLAALNVRVQGDMNMPGMVPVQVPALGDGTGTYVVNHFHFSMGGQWLLTVTGTLPDGSPFDYHLPPVEVAA